MIVEQYSFKRKAYIILAIVSFIVLALGAFFSRTSTLDCIYKIAISIYVAYTIIIVTEVVFRHFLYSIFAKENKIILNKIPTGLYLLKTSEFSTKFLVK